MSGAAPDKSGWYREASLLAPDHGGGGFFDAPEISVLEVIPLHKSTASTTCARCSSASLRRKGHLRLPSFSLIPQNDAVPAAHQLRHGAHEALVHRRAGAPPSSGLTTCQKCIRTGDIENIGKTARHGTYFEMLGNFSFGDYFKQEAIHLGLGVPDRPEWVGLEPDRLYPSVFAGNETTLPMTRPSTSGTRRSASPRTVSSSFGKEDNFWEHGSGPCGPCSEIYYDRGAEVRLRQARLHRGLRLRPLYGGLEHRVLPVRQRRSGPLHRAGAEEHRHRHGSGASGRASARTWTPCSMWTPS